MATNFTFNNKVIELPGSYSQFISGVTNPALSLSYGNVLLIDTGSGAGYGAGSGIVGDISSGADSIYEAGTLAEFRKAIGGGILWDIAQSLFQPNGAGGGNGISKLFYARAATTAAATVTLNYTAGTNGGTAVIQAKNEGLVGNGVETSSVLTQGYAVTLGAGVDDITKYIVKFWRGTFKGNDPNGYPWDEVGAADTLPELVVSSPEFTNIAELHTWMETDARFGSSFKLSSKTVVLTGAMDPADIVANAGNTLFAAGTETYDTARVDEILAQVQNLDYSLVLADGYGAGAQSVDNGKILAHIADGDTFGDKIMVVGGGVDVNSFALGTTNSSIDTAVYYDNDRVVVCHGGPIKNSTLTADGYVPRTSLHKAAVVCGRLAGLEPQIPITFKKIKIDGEIHKLSLKEQKQGLKYGVLMSHSDGQSFSVIQGVNSIQNNSSLVNPNGTTHSIQLRRMVAQVNRELVVNATQQLLKNPDGTNRNTLSASDIKTFTEGYLKGKTATTTADNLIISFRNVNVTIDNDAYKVTYDVIFNTEITKLFFTGTIFLNF